MPVFRMISIRTHAICDLLVVIATLLVPWAWGFAGLNPPSLFVWGIGIVGLLVNQATQYPLGVVRLIPLKVHSLLEYAAMPAFFILPFVFFGDVPGVVISIPVLGAINALTNMLSDYPAESVPATSRAVSRA